jgi:moderate conductance mechanosensitive channel
MTILFRTIFALLLGVSVLAMPAMAQSPLPGVSAGSDTAAEETALPDPLTPEAINEMVARMSDDEVRALLLNHLDAVAETQAAPAASGGSFFGRLNTMWVALYSNPLDAIKKLPTLATKEAEAIAAFGSTYGGLSGVLTLFGLIAAALAVGFAAEFIAERLTRRWQGQSVMTEDATLRDSLSFLFRRFMREIFGLIVFYFAMRTVGRAILSPEQMAFAGPMVTYLIWIPRLGAAVSRLVLAPKQTKLRLVNMDDHSAQFVHRHLIGLFILVGFTLFAVGFNLQFGASLAETRLGFWLDSAVYIYIAFIAWTARNGLTEMMRGTDPDRTPYDEKVALAYPYFAMGVAGATWVVVTILAGLNQVEQLLKGAHYTTMFWLLIAPALDTAVRGLVRHLVPPMSGEGRIAEDAYKSTKRSYIRIGRVILGGIVLVLIANAWDMDIADFTSNRQGFGASLIEFLMTLAVGYVVLEVVSLWINRKLAKEQTEAAQSGEDSESEGGAGGSRLATVLPLVLMSAQVAIGTIFGLLAIGALGIDITPLLAGAGILGLAIGFGAQKLVTDVVSGIFFLVDDAFRVGEYVEVDGTMGTVEKISIRSMQLRHHRGLVHTIPYGEIPKLTNFSRDWVIMKLMFTVPFDTDPNKVKKIFKKIGAEMMQDELFKDDFLEPFKSQGVFQFDDVGIVMRGKFMAKPGTQFTIRKEIYNRVRNEFKAAGIEFARREVRVAMPEHDDGTPPTEAEKAAGLTAAAGEVARQQAQAKNEAK